MILFLNEKMRNCKSIFRNLVITIALGGNTSLCLVMTTVSCTYRSLCQMQPGVMTLLPSIWLTTVLVSFEFIYKISIIGSSCWAIWSTRSNTKLKYLEAHFSPEVQFIETKFFFSLGYLTLTGATIGEVVAHDFTGDGFTDVLIPNYTRTELIILEQDASTNSTANLWNE